MPGLVTDYKTLCKSRATNAEYPLDLLDSLEKEIRQGLSGGVVSPSYLLEKLAALTRFATWLEKADEPEADYDDEKCDYCDKRSCGC